MHQKISFRPVEAVAVMHMGKGRMYQLIADLSTHSVTEWVGNFPIKCFFF